MNISPHHRQRPATLLTLLAVAGCVGIAGSMNPLGSAKAQLQVETPSDADQLEVSLRPSGQRYTTTPTSAGRFDVEATAPAGQTTIVATARAQGTVIGTAETALELNADITALVYLLVPDARPTSGGDHPPAITSLIVPSTTLVVGDRLKLTATAVDLDQDPLSYRWAQTCRTAVGTFNDPTSATPVWSALGPGTCSLTLTVTAGGATASRTVDVTVIGTSGSGGGSAGGGSASGGGGGTGGGSATGGGTVAANVTRHPFAALPAHGGTTLKNSWSNGEPRIFKDVTTGALVGFGYSDRLYAFVSTDLGGTWSFVDPANGQSVGTSDVLTAAQDSTGKVHLLFKDGPAGCVRYSRVALTTSGGTITSFAAEVNNVVLPGSYNTNTDVRGFLLLATDQSGAETLIAQVSDNAAGASFHLQLMKAQSLQPAATADFTKLDGTAGTTVAFSSTDFNNHDHSAFIAQLQATKDLWVFWGPTNAEYGAADPTFTTRLKLTPSGPKTWSVGAPITMVGSDATSSPEALALVGTANYVWFMYLHPTDGLSFDRVDAVGQLTHAVVPSPEATPHRNGWGVFSVGTDERRIWAVWNTMSRQGPGADDRTRQAFFNGATWATFNDSVVGDSWGMGGSVGVRDGVVATRLYEPNLDIALSAIFGGAAAP